MSVSLAASAAAVGVLQNERIVGQEPLRSHRTRPGLQR